MQVYVPGMKKEQGELKGLFPSQPGSMISSAHSAGFEGVKHGALSNPCSCPSFQSDVSTVTSTSGVSSMPSSVVHEGLENVPACAKDFPERLGLALGFLCSRSTASSAASEGAWNTLFAGSATPAIDIGSFCKRLHKYLRCSNEAWVAAFVYIDRAASSNWHSTRTLEAKIKSAAEEGKVEGPVTGTRGAMVLNEKTVHRLLLAALVLSLKMQDDTYYTNSYYAKVGGVTTQELNALESGLLQGLDWNVTVSTEEYMRYMSVVSSTAAAVSAAQQQQQSTA